MYQKMPNTMHPNATSAALPMTRRFDIPAIQSSQAKLENNAMVAYAYRNR
jgi:hypothetical protein